MTKARHEEAPPVQGGSLPTWLVGVAPSRPGMRIVCPHCARVTLVDAQWPVGGYATRPCTYCFKTAKVPSRLRGRRRRRPTTNRGTA